MSQQQYYSIQDIFPKGAIRSTVLLPTHTPTTLCLATDHAIELHTLTQEGLSHTRSNNLQCSIFTIKALPDHHRQTDFIFILDNQGNSYFYDVLLSAFSIRIPANKKYSLNHHIFEGKDSQDPLFCSQIHRVDVLDTKGSICFLHSHSIVVIDYSIKAEGLKVEASRSIVCPYVRCRQLGWVSAHSSKPELGVIEEIQERTIFKMHKLCRGATLEAASYEYEKINLIEFASVGPGEVLLLADQELILVSVVSRSVLARHSLHCRNGRLLVIQPSLYGCIGEELTLVGGTIQKAYGSLELEGRNILAGKEIEEASSMGRLPDGGKLVSLITSSNQLLLVSLYDNTWKLYDSVKGIGPIFSIQSANNSYVGVTSTREDHYGVWIWEEEVILPLQKQSTGSSLEQIVSLHKGQYLLLRESQPRESSAEVEEKLDNSCVSTGIKVMAYSQSDKSYIPLSILLPPLQGQLIAVNDHFLATTAHAYSWNVPEKTHSLLHKGPITLACLSITHMFLLDNQLILWHYIKGEDAPQKVRQASASQYMWYYHDGTLYVADSAYNAQLGRWQASTQLSQITLPSSSLISALSHQQDLLAVGFTSGALCILNGSHQVIFYFNTFTSHPVTFFQAAINLGVCSDNRAYLIEISSIHPQLLRLSDSSAHIQAIAFSSFNNCLISAHNADKGGVLCLASLEQYFQGLSEIDNRSRLIAEYQGDIPTVYADEQSIFIATPKKIQIFSWEGLQLKKTISNYLTQTVGIESMHEGLMVYGIDELRRNTLILLSKDQEVLATLHLLLKDRRYIKSIKVLPQTESGCICKCICRGQKQTVLFQVTDSFQINELSEVKTDLQGYSLQIDNQHNLMGFTDGFRFLAIYSYFPKMLPVCRQVTASEINEHLLLSKTVLTADKQGALTLFQYNTEDPQDPLKMAMTTVARITVGTEITSLALHSPRSALFGTVEGKVGRLRIIKQEEYRVLSKAELRAIQWMQQGCGSYCEWRCRLEGDKAVDGWLVTYFLRKCRQKGGESDLLLGKEVRQTRFLR